MRRGKRCVPWGWLQRRSQQVNGIYTPRSGSPILECFFPTICARTLVTHVTVPPDQHYFMSTRCTDCDAHTVWDDSVGSSVCTSCGSLADPSQSVLTSEPSFWHDNASTTLKSIRSGNNWDLSGQGKEVRDGRHAVRHLS